MKLLISLLSLALVEPSALGNQKNLRVPHTPDFELSGEGTAAPWSKAPWEALTPRESRKDLSHFKILYSDSGLYVLFQGEDRRITATKTEDFSELWNEDVFEAFLWPDESTPIYLEYEISPLGAELALLVPNLDGKFQGWLPWDYKGGRRARKATSVQGGGKKPGSEAKGWTAEIFLPYRLLAPLKNVPPKPGMSWRANFYRSDKDEKQAGTWDWSRVGPKFHEPAKFGYLKFE
jgi:hypothetical protein